VRELKDRNRVRERGVKVRPRGRTLREWRGKGPMVKGGRGHCWEKESEKDGSSEKERDKRRQGDGEKQNETHAFTIYWAAADVRGKCFLSKITLAEYYT